MIGLALLRAAAVTLAATPGLLLLRRAPARVRHAAFAAALAASAAAPFAGGLVPTRVVEVTPALPPVSLPLLAHAPLVAAAPPKAPLVAPTAPTRTPTELPEALVLLPALALFGRLFLGWATVRRWARRATPRPDGTLLSPDAKVPMTFFDGRRHQVLLPAEAADWNRERLDAVLLHERAHVARGDWWSQTAARLVVALQWMNPLAWWALRGLVAAAEECADGAALRAGVAPAAYARELLALARPGPRPAGALPLTPRSDVGRRVIQVLRGPRRAPFWAVGLAALLPFAFVVPAAAIGAGRAMIYNFGRRQLARTSTPFRHEGDRFGDATNRWTGELPDAGDARLEYVVGWFGGKPRAWRPDGTPVALAGLPIAPVPPAPEYAYDVKTKQMVKTGRGVANERMFAIGFDDPTGVMEGGAQSASDVEGPRYQEFGRGSWTTNPGRPGHRVTAGFVAFPRGFGVLRGAPTFKAAVGFATGPADARPIFTFDRARGANLVTNPSFVTNFEQSDFAFRDEPKGRGTSLTIGMARIPQFPNEPWLVAVATGLDGKVDTQSPVLEREGPKAFAHPFYRYDLPRPRSAYRSIQVLAGATSTTEFQGVALLPNDLLATPAARERWIELGRAQTRLGEAEDALGEYQKKHPADAAGIASRAQAVALLRAGVARKEG